MKRFAAILLTAVLGIGGAAPLALAHDDNDHNRDWRSGSWDRDDDWDRDRDHDGRWSRHHSRDDRLYSDPVYRALRESRGIRINNVFAGGRYVSSGQFVSVDTVRIVDLNRDGTYDVWFNGRVYPAYARSYRGRTLLYLGNAPTPQGYLYELVID